MNKGFDQWRYTGDGSEPHQDTGELRDALDAIRDNLIQCRDLIKEWRLMDCNALRDVESALKKIEEEIDEQST